MSFKSRFTNRSLLLPLFALLAVVALAVGVAPRYSTSHSDPSIHQGQNSPFHDLINAFQPQTVTFGPDIRANSDTTTNGQHEPSLAMSRVHTDTVVVASKDYRNGNQKEVWIDTSTDGGQTWPAALQLQMPGINPSLFPLMSDPVVVARDDGRIYVACLGYSNSNGVFITWTDDDGVNWHTPSVQISPNDGSLDDKDWFAVDNTPSSPYYHRMYILYAPGGASHVAEQHSTDGGLTWSTRQNIPNGSGMEYTYPVIAADGTVYNFMMDNWGSGITGTINYTKSTNGGVTWSNPTPVTGAQQPNSPIRGSDSFRFFAILSAAVDPNNGSLYVAWTDNRNFNTNGTDVMYVKSTDSGASWTAPIRLSHDPTGVVRDHITPVITVGADSRLHAFWLDRRLDTSNYFWNSWYSTSTDGGTTWEPDVRVSTAAQDLNLGLPPGSGGAAGDYWGLDTYADTVYVAWNDARTSEQDILVSRGYITSGSVPSPTPTTPITPSPTLTDTPTPTNTNTPPPTSTPTNTSTPTITSTPVPTQTPGGATATPIPTGTATSTSTGTPTTAPTDTPLPTNTQGIATTTPIPTTPTTSTPMPTNTSAIPTPTNCPTQFEDVLDGSTFYIYIQDLSCRAVVNGYPCGGPGEPCVGPGNRPYFRPADNVTRGQLSKIIALAANLTVPPPTQSFQDVPGGSTFHPYVEALYAQGAINGYPCGGPNEPCIAPGNLPYFRPNDPASRGQISKIVAITANDIDPATTRTFQDVPTNSTFYLWIENLAQRGIITGYPCGSPNEPCIAPDNRPYFRPADNVTRGQMSKIADITFP